MLLWHFIGGNINELVADVVVIGEGIPDKHLLNMVRGVLKYGDNGITE